MSDELTPQEKAAKLAWQFAVGEQMTISEAADSFGMTYQGARRIIYGVSRVIPIAPDGSGRWRRFSLNATT